MANFGEGLISIKPEFAEAILAKEKTVELRRRIPLIEEGTRLWIYATMPVGAVVGSAKVKSIMRGSPSQLWQKVKNDVLLSREEYDAYFDGAGEAVGIFLEKVKKGKPIGFEKLRGIRTGFHPPQVILRLTEKEAASLGRLLVPA